MSQSPTVFLSYSHDSEEHASQVLALSDRLIADGVDVFLDQYDPSPAEGWPVWMESRFEKAKFVILICTETYLRRVKREEAPGVGQGVRWEGNLLYNSLYGDIDQGKRFLPVLFERGDPKQIPNPLRGYTYYVLTQFDFSDPGYDALYRQLTGQPSTPRPEPGPIKVRPARPRTEPTVEKRSASTGDAEGNPQFFKVPYARNPFFSGRDRQLADLHSKLTAADVPTRIWAVSGMGGVGKTQTTLEYVYRYRDHYRFILWARADTATVLGAEYVRMASEAGFPPGASGDPDEAREWFKQWLERESRYLVVLDNVDDPEVVHPFLPTDPRGRILITSRMKHLESLRVVEPIELAEMSSEEALDFLGTRTRRWNDDPGERAAAETIAKELGYLPLALEQAAAFIAVNDYRFQDYLADFLSLRLKLLDEETRSAWDQGKTIRTCWQKSFESVAAASEGAADLLTLSAFLSPDRIPYELIAGGGPALGGPVGAALREGASSQLLLNRPLTLLTRYALIRRDIPSRTYSVHRLIQAVIRDRLDPAAQRAAAERCIRAVNAMFPWVDFPVWSRCDRLVPHALECALWIKEFALASSESGRLLNQTAYYLKERAQYTVGEELFRRSLAIREKANDLDTAQTCNDLGALYANQGRYAEAEPLHRQALMIREARLGPMAPDVGGSLNHLSRVLRNLDRDDEAESLGLRALAIAESVGAEHFRVAVTLCNLARLFVKRDRFDRAEPLATRGVAICRKILQSDHPDLGYALRVLADVYHASGRYAEAEPLYRESIAISEVALSREHPIVLRSLAQFAALLRKMGHDQEAGRIEFRISAVGGAYFTGTG